MVRGDVTQVENQNGLRNTRRSRQVGMERVHVRSQAASPCTELHCVRALRALAPQSRSDRRSVASKAFRVARATRPAPTAAVKVTNSTLFGWFGK